MIGGSKGDGSDKFLPNLCVESCVRIICIHEKSQNTLRGGGEDRLQIEKIKKPGHKLLSEFFVY